MTNVDVIVIGAGIAGLACTDRLLELAGTSDSGRASTIAILESSDHIGGRALSSDFGGVRVNCGAQYLHTYDTNPMRLYLETHGALDATAKRAGVDKPWDKPQEWDKDTRAVFSGAQNVTKEYAEAEARIFHPILETLSDRSQMIQDNWVDHSSANNDENLLSAFTAELKRRKPSQLQWCLARLYLKKLTGYIGAHDLTKASATWTFDLGECAAEGGDAMLLVGADAIAEHLWDLARHRCAHCQSLPAVVGNSSGCEHVRLLLNHRATTVQYHTGGVTVTAQTHDGERVFRAKKAVITVPLGVLQRPAAKGGLDFAPLLPPRKRRAIETQGFGNLNKIFVRFRDVFWRPQAAPSQSAPFRYLCLLPAAPRDNEPSVASLSEAQTSSALQSPAQCAASTSSSISTSQPNETHRGSDDGGELLTGFVARTPPCLSPDGFFGWVHCVDHEFPGTPVLAAFVSGPDADAIDHASDEEALQWFLAGLRRTFGEVVTRDSVVSQRITRWGVNPHAFGTYATPTLGSSGMGTDILGEPVTVPLEEGEKGAAAGAASADSSSSSDSLSRATAAGAAHPEVPVLFFAGEATCRRWIGCMHGAWETGRSAAEQAASALVSAP